MPVFLDTYNGGPGEYNQNLFIWDDYGYTFTQRGNLTAPVLEQMSYANRRLTRYGVTVARVQSLVDRMNRNGIRIANLPTSQRITQDMVEIINLRWQISRRRGRPRTPFVPVSTPTELRESQDVLDENPMALVKPDDCPCKVCKHARRDGTRIPANTIHTYSYSPRTGWKPRHVKADKAKYYLGVELETDNYGQVELEGSRYRDTIRGEISNGRAAGLRLPKSLWVAKSDSSVSGPEFASHPATISYWNAHRVQIAEMFTNLLHAGFRSHDNDRCGMHVNISRTAFETEDHLRRFLMLLHIDPEWSRKVAQRTKNSTSWAKFTLNSNEAIDDFIRRTRNNGGSSDKYMVLGAPYNEPRYEFRLPRGTLRVDRFFKNLQWVTTMIDYTRPKTRKAAELTPAKYMEFVQKNKKDAPDLLSFLVERGFLPA